MENWLERVKKSVFPRSVEKTDIRKALAEWFYTGDTYDLETPNADCELCDHPNIRFQFAIQNRHTTNELLIGSECITRFDIPALGGQGEILSAIDTKRVVEKDRRKLITDAKQRRMIQTLIELKKKEPTIDIDDFITYYKDRGAFTPKQLAFLLWRLDSNGIEYHARDFKLTMKRGREKEQLLNMKDFQIVAMLPCLSAAQKDFLRKHGRI